MPDFAKVGKIAGAGIHDIAGDSREGREFAIALLTCRSPECAHLLCRRQPMENHAQPWHAVDV
jgi:hypothetical protein